MQNSRVVFLVIAVICVFVIVLFGSMGNECAARSGVLVRGMWGPACVAAPAKP